MSYKCIKIDQTSAYFILNLQTWAFIGNMMELLRLPNIFNQILVVLGSASIPEMRIRSRAVSHDTIEFVFGMHMAYFLTNFSISCFLNVLSPLVGPFGLLYSINKHMVDSYNLIVGSYRPSKVNVHQFHLIVANILVCVGILSCLILYSYITFVKNNTFLGNWGRYMIFIPLILSFVQIQSHHRYPFPLFSKGAQWFRTDSRGQCAAPSHRVNRTVTGKGYEPNLFQSKDDPKQRHTI